MSFEDLPQLPPLLHPDASGYASRCMAATRIVQGRTQVKIDCRYGDDYWQKLDVYLPSVRSKAPVPCLVFFHGGAWINGTKEWMGFMAPPLLALPAIYVTANYRLAPKVKHPALVEDCLDALAWVRGRLHGWGGDPDQLFVGGHSAGGHLAALATLDLSRREAHGLSSGAIKACLTISGPFDVRTPHSMPASCRAYEDLLERQEDAPCASPIVFANAKAPPFFISWGEHDFPHLIDQGREMAKTLSGHGRDVRMLEIPGADHFGANEICADNTSEWVRITRQWLSGRIG